MRKRNMLLGLVLVFILLLSAWAYPLLTQEENTVSVLSGIVRLTFSEAEIVQYDDDEGTQYFVSRSSLDEKLIEQVLPEEGFVFTDQMGSGYIFTDKEDPSRSRIVLSRQFTRFYRLWKIPKDQEG